MATEPQSNAAPDDTRQAPGVPEPSQEELESATAAQPGAAPAEEPSGGLLSRLNPIRMFRRNTAEGHVDEGRDLLDNGSLTQAQVAFNTALQLDPNCTPAYRGLAKVFLKRGGRSNLENALKQYQEALRRRPKEYDLYAMSAKVYDALGKRKEATLERKKFVIVRALEADPGNPVANNNMGILFLQQGRTHEALEYFNRAIHSDRTYDVAHRNLAAAYLKLAKHAANDDERVDMTSRARDAIKRALEISPNVPTLLAHARIVMADGNLEEVLTVLDRVDKMTPANPEVYFIKKMALEGLGRFEEARDAQESYQVFRKQAHSTPAAAPAPR